MRDGYSLVEVALTLTLIGLLLLIAYPVTGGWRDRAAVRRASLEVAAFYQAARHNAMWHAAPVAVVFTPESLTAVFPDTRDSAFAARPGPRRLGVTLTASTREVRIQPNGFGLGAANTKIIVRRGTAAESLTTSRLGRLRRWP